MLEFILKKEFPGYNFLFNESLQPYTYTKLGGKAECLFIPENGTQLKNVLHFLNSKDVPVFILGNGSNIIISDEGLSGVVIYTGEMNNIMVNDHYIVAESGARIIDVSKVALKYSLTGIEFACGIPASVGGALFMNAGAYGGEMKDVVESVKAMDKNGRVFYLKKDELNLGYRDSIFQHNDWIILEVMFRLNPGNKEKIKMEMDNLTEKREKSQPLEYPSCGSVFKRPNGYYSGKLIRESGLQGLTVGGAQVSLKHSGFIVNIGNATSDDYKKLIRIVQDEVKEKFGVKLEREVRYIN